MKIIDGKKIATEIKEKLKKEIATQKLTPGLAIILVGNNEASEIYVKNKIKACQAIGINAHLYRFNETNTEEEIIKCICALNKENAIHGIIVQSPVPKIFNENLITSFINPKKDVDGFGVMNMGYLATNQAQIIAATPYGIIKMLEYENIAIEGKNIVIIGRSNIVGRPLALALLNKNATVTITHSKTKNLKDITNKADILISAIGKPNFITKDYIKENAIIIDVGINKVNGKITGDVNLEDVKEKASYITPTPGGVGPMTIAMLLNNVVESAKKKEGKK